MRLALAIAFAALSICLELSDGFFRVDGDAGGVLVPDSGTYKVIEGSKLSTIKGQLKRLPAGSPSSSPVAHTVRYFLIPVYSVDTREYMS